MDAVDGAQLPRLPIPEVAETCERYLTAVTPLLSEEDLERTRAAVAQFLARDADGLQAALREYARDKPSYVEDFWFDAYLKPDEPVVLNVNPFFVLADDPMPSAGDAQISRAASLVISSLHFCAKLRRGELLPDAWRGKPLCMAQYGYLFACARVPSSAGDRIESHAGSQHIVVMAHGLLYYFDVLWPACEELCISEAQLAENLRRIRADARDVVGSTASAADALAARVGVLTTDSRAEWAAARHELARAADNAELLRVVDSALFVLCLDDESPSEPDEIARTMLHGSYRVRDGVQCGSMLNRWCDKLMVIVCANGAAGVNFEHTRVDGHTVLRYVSDVFADTIMRFAAKISAGIDPAVHSAAPLRLARADSERPRARGRIAPAAANGPDGEREPDPWPRRLEWQAPRGSRLRQRVRFAEVRLSDLVWQNETCVLEFEKFGKLAITKLDASPDAFVQLALSAAYFSLYGQLVCVYEPVQTKAFAHGRTEAARTMTPAAARFARTWASDSGDDAKEGALRAALLSINELHRLAAAGKGVDRHLFALLKLWEERAPAGAQLPALFADKAWRALNHTVLSTSNCGNPALRLFGFGPVVADGYGLGYIIKDYRLSFCASSKHRQTARLLETLDATLRGMRDVLSRVQARRRSLADAEGADYGFFADQPLGVGMPDGTLRALSERRESEGPARPGKRIKAWPSA
ncbi:hypothetical protein KFE25_010616 [Diacronema lutheri]|uniref:Choline/carnitine acyltransferase domain-containing protein n=1 Tax=Diacronema lutheri TaxID=2081491 RepID=A0A8J5XC14_DIALT|nr:hypothetical protein KFE25_010616 [Diacronema lutheri]